MITCALLSEIALQAKQAGQTLIDLLRDLYRRYGIHREQLTSINYPETREGRDCMHQAMVKLRQKPLKELDGAKVIGGKIT